MKTRTVKKNNPALLSATGRTGFFGGVLAIRFGMDFVVLQNVKGHPKGSPVLSFCGTELSEDHFRIIRQLYLKKYGTELGTLKSVYNFAGATQNGEFFERAFGPINNQYEFSDRTFKKNKKGKGLDPVGAGQATEVPQPVHLQYRDGQGHPA